MTTLPRMLHRSDVDGEDGAVGDVEETGVGAV
jgi:hypothetical protein